MNHFLVSLVGFRWTIFLVGLGVVGGRGNSCVGGREEADMGWWEGGMLVGVGGGRLGGGHRSPREPAIRVGSVSKIYRK